MTLYWPQIIFLFCLAIPGILTAIPRLIKFLLPNNSPELQRRFSFFGIVQSLFMTFFMSLAGSVLSVKTGMGDPILDAILQGKSVVILPQLLPVLLITLVGLIFFLAIYYGFVARILDEPTYAIMKKFRLAIGLDGCMLYGGVVEEILVRWGLVNVIIFFALMFGQRVSVLIICTAILISSVLYSLCQLPAYLAAGCKNSRRFMYTLILLYVVQGGLFGWIFWQYGLLFTIFSHMIFHLGWYFYDKKP